MADAIGTRPPHWARFAAWFMPRATPWHVRAYRLLHGRLVDRASGGAPVVLLTTVGRRTGRRRTVAVGHIRDGDDVIVVGSNGGRHPLPGWVHNLQARPDAVVEFGAERWPAGAIFLEGPEWQAHWNHLVTDYPIYEKSRLWAGREIPLIRLRRL